CEQSHGYLGRPGAPPALGKPTGPVGLLPPPAAGLVSSLSSEGVGSYQTNRMMNSVRRGPFFSVSLSLSLSLSFSLPGVARGVVALAVASARVSLPPDFELMPASNLLFTTSGNTELPIRANLVGSGLGTALYS